jgi:hypothetical protein
MRSTRKSKMHALTIERFRSVTDRFCIALCNHIRRHPRRRTDSNHYSVGGLIPPVVVAEKTSSSST